MSLYNVFVLFIMRLKKYIKVLFKYPFYSWPHVILSPCVPKIRPFQWIIVSTLIKFYLKKTDISKILRENNFKRVILINKNTPAKYNNNYVESIKKQRYMYADTFVEDWFEEMLNIKVENQELKDVLSGSSSLDSIIVIQPTEPSFTCIREIYTAMRLKKQGLPVVALIVDTFVASHGLMAGIYVAITGGVTVFLSNTKEEAARFGWPHPVGPIFWTFPQARYGFYKKFNSETLWETRKNIIIYPSDGGDPQGRFEIGKILETKVLHGRYSIVKAGGLSFEEYLKLLSQAKLYFTTTTLAPFFVYGPKIYKDRISTHAITGQVWEAFASGCVVVTSKCQALNEYGFISNIHYLDLDDLIIRQKRIPTNNQLKKIASSGNLHFEKMISKKQTFLE